MIFIILAMFVKSNSKLSVSQKKYSPNQHQFCHVRHQTIFELIFKKLPKLEKDQGVVFKPKKECWF